MERLTEWTIQDLYNYCVEHGYENYTISFYECSYWHNATVENTDFDENNHSIEIG